MSLWKLQDDHYHSESILGDARKEWGEKYEGSPREVLVIVNGPTSDRDVEGAGLAKKQLHTIIEMLEECIRKSQPIDSVKLAIKKSEAAGFLFIAEGDEAARSAFQAANHKDYNDSDWCCEISPQGIITTFSQWSVW